MFDGRDNEGIKKMRTRNDGRTTVGIKIKQNASIQRFKAKHDLETRIALN